MAAQLTRFLQLLVQQRGSDLHISASAPPMLRVKGELKKVEMPPLQAKEIESIFSEVLSEAQKKILVTQRSIDFAIKVGGLGIFRANIFYQRHGLAGVFRALSEKPPALEELGLPPICRVACSFPTGLVLVTGPTGSGKSSTLAAMINFINENTRKHIITLEDPIEYQHESKRCMVNQRQLNTHFTSFQSALKSALREDPDIILVGELRDIETMSLAISAAETGHLVFATLHTNSAPKAVDRILDSYPPEQVGLIRSMLSESLRIVLSQKLVPKADGSGRVLIQDILVNNPAVGNLLREGKTHQLASVMQTGKSSGMQVMDQMLQEYVARGVVSGHDAFEYANDKALFVQYAPPEVQALVARGYTSVGPAGGQTQFKKSG